MTTLDSSPKHNRPSVPQVTKFTEGLIYTGIVTVGFSEIVFQALSLSDNATLNVFPIAVATLYFIGVFAIFTGGITALTQLSESYQLIWYLLLFAGSQFSLWSPAIAMLGPQNTRLIHSTIVIFGGLLTCLSIATIQMFRRVAHRTIFKGCIIVGIALCHTVSIVDIHGYIWIPFDIGMVLVAVGYITGLYLSSRRISERVTIQTDEEKAIMSGTSA